MIPWGWGAKSVHGVPKGYRFRCCGRRARASDEMALVYLDGSEACARCAEASYSTSERDEHGFVVHREIHTLFP